MMTTQGQPYLPDRQQVSSVVFDYSVENTNNQLSGLCHTNHTNIAQLTEVSSEVYYVI